jgi:hypothetical protein
MVPEFQPMVVGSIVSGQSITVEGNGGSKMLTT